MAVMETNFDEILRPVLKSVLEEMAEEEEDSDSCNTPSKENCSKLLEGPPDGKEISWDTPPPDSIPADASPSLLLLIGYPTYPLYHRLSSSVSHWMTTGHCPVLDLPEMFLLNERDALEKRLQHIRELTPKLTEAYSRWECWALDEKKCFVKQLLNWLSLRGVLDLLGVRETAGSVSVLPPSRELLLESFTRLNSPPSKLTVGARALAKHHHRDNSLSWWGQCTGSEAQKNAHSLRQVMEIMSTAMWINLHTLPHKVKVVEIRNGHGYGVRWLLDGTEFRGFLEPQMADGHALGWRH